MQLTIIAFFIPRSVRVSGTARSIIVLKSRSCDLKQSERHPDGGKEREGNEAAFVVSKATGSD